MRFFMTNGFWDPQHLGATHENAARLAALIQRRRKTATLNPTAFFHKMCVNVSSPRGVSAMSIHPFQRIAAKVRLA